MSRIRPRLFLLLLVLLHTLLASQNVRRVYNGKILVGEYHLSGTKQQGVYKQWYPDGRIQSAGTVSGNARSGTNYWYYETDTVRKKVEFTSSYTQAGRFNDYKMHEVITEYWENGKPKSIAVYERGKEQFGTTRWYSNGNLRTTATYDSLHTHRIYSEYFESGRIRSIRPFLDSMEAGRSIQDGIYREWNKYGVQIVESNTKHGKQDGMYREWDSTGHMVNESYYENGLVIAQKKWDGKGNVIVDFDRRKADNSIEAIYYFNDKKTIRQVDYVKRFQVGDSLIAIHYRKLFNDKGVVTSITASMRSQASSNATVCYWLGNQTSIPVISWNNTPVQVKASGINDDYLKVNQGYKNFRLYCMYNPSYPGPFPSPQFTALELEKGFQMKKAPKLIQSKVNDIRSQSTDPKKINKDYLLTDAEVDRFSDLYTELLPKICFDSAVLATQFDTSGNGLFTVTYSGTKMKCTGQLREGMLDGKFIVMLDDNHKLDEFEFSYGLRHGDSRTWFINGNPAHFVHYELNQKTGVETYFYFTGGRMLEYEYDEDGKTYSETKWYQNGQMSSYVIHSKIGKNAIDLKDEWYANGKPKTICVLNDSIYQSATLNEAGQVTGITLNDYRRNISFYKNQVGDKLYRNVKVDDPSVKEYVYSFSHNGVSISGRIWRDESSGSWNIEDNMGLLVQKDRNIISFRKDLPCECADYTSHDFFNTPTSNFISQENFLKYQMDFHQPITHLDRVFGDPHNNFGEYHPVENYSFGKEYSFYAPMVVIGDLSFALPDSNGIIFSISPCRSKSAFVPVNADIKFKFGFPSSTEITFTDTKTLSIQFSPEFLQGLDDDGAIKRDTTGKAFGAMYLFSGGRVLYNKEREIDVAHAHLVCEDTCLFTGTKIRILFNSFYPDLSTTLNYPAMTAAYDDRTTVHPSRKALGCAQDHVDHFRGVYSDDAFIFITYPNGKDSVALPFNATDLLVGAHFTVGTMMLDVKSVGDGKYVFQEGMNTGVTVSSDELSKELSAYGWKNQISFDPERSQLVIDFYYEK